MPEQEKNWKERQYDWALHPFANEHHNIQTGQKRKRFLLSSPNQVFTFGRQP